MFKNCGQVFAKIMKKTKGVPFYYSFEAKTDFIALLKEKAIDRHARYNDIKKKIDADPRYKAVEGGVMREDYFREYCKLVKDDRRKDKDNKERDRSSSSKKDKKEKEKDKDKDKDKDKEKEKDKDKDGKKEKKKEKDQEKVSAAEDAAEDEAEAADAAASGSESEEAARRAARAQASIKEREREVQRALATSLRDRDKEREHHKRDEAQQHFNALLADLVRNPELTWREAKKQLKKDHRYALAELLSKEDKERLFSQHIALLGNKRRDKFRALLTELGATSTAHWRDVRAMIDAATDRDVPQYSSSKQMEREFREHQRALALGACAAFRQLLGECRTISHRTRAALDTSPSARAALHDALRTDARYTALDHAPAERDQLIAHYLEELERKGPPPPPTATPALHASHRHKHK